MVRFAFSLPAHARAQSRTPRSRWLASLALGVAAVALFGLPQGSSAQINVGEPAPDFTKTTLAGGTVSLSDYEGKVVVLFLLGYG